MILQEGSVFESLPDIIPEGGTSSRWRWFLANLSRLLHHSHLHRQMKTNRKEEKGGGDKEKWVGYKATPRTETGLFTKKRS